MTNNPNRDPWIWLFGTLLALTWMAFAIVLGLVIGSGAAFMME